MSTDTHSLRKNLFKKLEKIDQESSIIMGRLLLANKLVLEPYQRVELAEELLDNQMQRYDLIAEFKRIN